MAASSLTASARSTDGYPKAHFVLSMFSRVLVSNQVSKIEIDGDSPPLGKPSLENYLCVRVPSPANGHPPSVMQMRSGLH